MENNDLIKKLENIELPEIGIQNHKRELRIALLDSKHFQKSNFLEILKKFFIFTVPSLALLILVGVTIIQPRLIENRAIAVAKSSSEVQKLIAEENMNLQEVKVKDDKAYVLFNLPEERGAARVPAIQLQRRSSEEAKNIEGAIVKIDLNKKTIDRIKIIEAQDILSLTNQEKEAAKEIIRKEAIVREVLLEGYIVEKVEIVFPGKLRLIERDDEILVAGDPSAEKKVQVHYTSDGKRWIIQVNLTEEKVEGIQYSPENE